MAPELASRRSAAVGTSPVGLAVGRSPLIVTDPDPAQAAAWLRAGRIDEGMQAALGALARATRQGLETVGPPAALADLIAVLRENPFLGPASAGHDGWPSEALVRDLALELAPLPLDTTAVGLGTYRWMTGHSRTFAAFRARRDYLARCIDASAERHPGAAVAEYFAGHARELAQSRAFRDGRVPVRLFDFDRGALAVARTEAGHLGRLDTRPISLAEILAGRLAPGDYSLACVPTAGAHLDDATLTLLLETLVGTLRTDGELVLASLTRLPEPGLVELAAGIHVNCRTPVRLLALARDIDDALATVVEDEPLGLAWLHIRRQGRPAAHSREDPLG
jgi:hypothetical protein